MLFRVAPASGELPEGLGTDIDTIKRLCEKDKEALDLIDRATQNPNGRPAHAGTVYNVQGSGNHSVGSKIDNVQLAPTGNTTAASIRRLRKDRPDLHQSVIAGDLSPHADQWRKPAR